MVPPPETAARRHEVEDQDGKQGDYIHESHERIQKFQLVAADVELQEIICTKQDLSAVAVTNHHLVTS